MMVKYDLEFILSIKANSTTDPFPHPISVKKSQKDSKFNKWAKHCQEAPLVRGENAWVAKKDYADENERIVKVVVGILNKLSKDNFEKLYKKFDDIEIDNKSLVESVIEIIFQKAINEPHFGEVYACLCKRLADKNYCEGEDGVNFKREILSQCQKEFEKDKTESTDPVVALTLKRKCLGNIKFVGELFIKGMISHSVIFQCIHKLVDNFIETTPESNIPTLRAKVDSRGENIECFCKLVTTVGEFLDNNNHSKRLGYYLGVMKAVSDDKSNDFRSRFMIKDLLDLRRDKWVSRRPKDVVKTKKEVRDDFEKNNKVKVPVNKKFFRKF